MSRSVLAFQQSTNGAFASRGHRALRVRVVPARVISKVVVRATETERSSGLSSFDTIAIRSIDNLDTDYCDDFVCTSSPAVEQTVRSFARELQRGRYSTTELFQRNVQYSDGFRNFTGPDGYLKQRWLADSIEKRTVTIVKMRMLDKGTSQVEWCVQGQLGSLPVAFSSTITCDHNLLTGRISTHRETWDLKRCSPPAALALTLSRMAWSARQMLADAQDGMSKATSKLGESMGGGQAGGAPGMGDPTKFYTQPDNNQSQDFVAVGFLIALLYLAFRLFGELERLG